MGVAQLEEVGTFQEVEKINILCDVIYGSFFPSDFPQKTKCFWGNPQTNLQRGDKCAYIIRQKNDTSFNKVFVAAPILGGAGGNEAVA